MQGGTQYNLAAVKAQVDFIESRFVGKGEKPNIIVHEHTGESGAIGAGLEAIRMYENGHRTSFIGLDAVANIQFKTTRNEDTRCYFCKNKCLRTFIDVKTTNAEHSDPLTFDFKLGPEAVKAGRIRDNIGDNGKNGKKEENKSAFKSKVPLEANTKRLIIATCEKGTVENVQDMRGIKGELEEIMKANPDLLQQSASYVFKSFKPEIIVEEQRRTFTPKQKRRKKLVENRKNIRIGIPRLLNMYSMNPLFSAYFESLGIKPVNILYSEFTSEEMFKEGAKRGSIDPCFPSKVGIPHVHNLLYKVHPKKKLDIIFFPMIDDLPSPLVGTTGQRSCPTISATPEAVKAAFTKEGNLFDELGVKYINTFVNPLQPLLFARQMFNDFADIFGLTESENKKAVDAGYKALDEYKETLQNVSRDLLKQLEEEDKIGIVVLGRPYHNDPGINHEIMVEFQKLGFPIFTQEALPIDKETLYPLFKEDLEKGIIDDPLEIKDVWKNAYSENTNYKIWAAKFTARHPNLVAMEMSNFKCGHDAPIYSVIEDIIENSGTPYFSFKDIDENKPTGAIKIRVETISYFLKRYREKLVQKRKKRDLVARELREYEAQLRRELQSSGPASGQSVSVEDKEIIAY